VSVRDAFASVTGAEAVAVQEVIDEAAATSNRNVLSGLEFDEISVISEVWVEPVLSKRVQRALSEATTFKSLGLHQKAEYVLSQAIAENPECAELREELCALLAATSDVTRFCQESVALAQLYAARHHTERARLLLERALQASPARLPEAQAQLEALGASI
jgi:thioredoxin-like negative regulator of GroEL